MGSARGTLSSMSTLRSPPPVTAAAQKCIRANGIALWTEGFGDPSDAPLLLIMGANASAMYWPEEFIALLVRGKRYVVRYDHRDTGRSTKRDFEAHPYSVEDLAYDALAVLDGYGFDSAHIVGLSMGGTIGQILALEYPRRVRSLTVTMTAALDVDFVGNVGRALRGEPSPDGLPTPDPRVLEVLARRGTPSPDRDAEIARRVFEWRVLSQDELPFFEEEYRRLEERAIEHDGTLVQPSAHARITPFPIERGREIHRVTRPTLVIQGSKDPLNPPPHGQHLAEMMPHARLVEVRGMGHALSPALYGQLARLILEHTT